MKRFRRAIVVAGLWAAMSPLTARAQSPNHTAAANQANAERAQEQTGVAPASVRDAAAIQDAENGWYKDALKGRDSRLEWWRDARFGCFIHWGPYSVLGGEWKGRPNPGYAEHIIRVNRIPVDVYRDEVASRFHPDKFDAKEWVRLIKGAGMRYIVITAKHHDGFAIWPSNVDKYNIRDVSHFDRDPLRELVDAARAQGLHIGFYYSHAFDWADPNAPGNDWDYSNPGGDRMLYGGADWYNKHPELLPRIHEYVKGKAIPQLQELISRYHPDILWFDTPGKLPLFEQIAIVKAVRAADPNVVINGRAAVNGLVNFGDYRNTADRPAELRPTPGDWEAIPTTNESYGWNKLDHAYKPVSYFVQLLAKAAAKGGNILLNIGPRGDGTIDPQDVATLEGIGRWMDVNAQSIRGTSRTPLDRQAWGDSTRRGDTLYLHVFRWPAGHPLIVGGLKGSVKRAYLLADPHQRPLATARVNAIDLAVNVPVVAPDADDSVIVLQMQPGFSTVPGRLLTADAAGNQLLGFDAKTQGSGFSYGDGKTVRDYVDGLQIRGNRLIWDVRVDQAASYQVKLQYSTPTADFPPGARFVVRTGTQTISASVVATATERMMTTLDLGTLHLVPGQNRQLTVELEGASSPVHFFELDLRALRAERVSE